VLTVPDYPDPQDAPGVAIPEAVLVGDLVQIGGLADPTMGSVSGRWAVAVFRSGAAFAAGAPRVDTLELRFGDGVIPSLAEALADPEFAGAYAALRAWLERKLRANRFPDATIS
jgi:hypothetical protein